MSIILPNATMGVVHQVGEILTQDFKNGISIFVRDNVTVIRRIVDGEPIKEQDIVFGEKQTADMAKFFQRASDMLSRQGGSGLPPTRNVAPTIYR